MSASCYWRRLEAIAGKAAFEHVSGWRVMHCGHPTANWPYYLVSPAGEMIVAQNGRGFQKAELAKAAVLQLLAGMMVLEIVHPDNPPRAVPKVSQ